MTIWLVKVVHGRPTALLWVIGYLTLGMTTVFSNIPTILILTLILIILVRELKLPYFPFFFVLVVMANIGGAMAPISDPTTYYQAKTVGLGFGEVLGNSGLIVIMLSVVVLGYASIVFRKNLAKVKISEKDVSLFQPGKAIRNKTVL